MTGVSLKPCLHGQCNSAGIALAAVMGLLVESFDERRSKGTSGPLVRTVLGIAALVIVFVVVLVRFQFVSS
jgi:hypothetical protein